MKQFVSLALAVCITATFAVCPTSAQTVKKESLHVEQGHELFSDPLPSPVKITKKPGSEFIPLSICKATSSKFSFSMQGRALLSSLPQISSAPLPDIKGSVVYSTNSKSHGLYNVGKADPDIFVAMTNATAAGVVVDNVYYCTSYEYIYGIYIVSTYGYDMESGKEVFYCSSAKQDVAIGLTVDPSSGNVYGITYNSDFTGFQLSKVTYNNEEKSVTTECLCDLPGNWNSFAIDKEGNFYGIRFYGEYDTDGNMIASSSSLCQIDRVTYEINDIGATGMAPQYMSSAAIDPKSNIMYWNVCDASGSSVLCTVDLTTGAADPILTYTYGDEILSMYIPAPDAEDGAPGAVSDVTIDFMYGGMNGTATVTAPSTLYDGSAASGEVTITVKADNVIAGSIECGYGETVQLPLTLQNPGLYNFSIFASNSVGDGPKTQIKNIYVGADTPEATSASLVYLNGDMEISWNEVTGTVNGGFLDTDNLTYRVERMDGTIAAEGLTTTTFSETVAEPDDLQTYYYTVYAVVTLEDGRALVSAPARTNTVTIGSVQLPWTSNFATDGLEGFTILNENGDLNTWEASSSGYAQVRWNSTEPMDDWLITPPVKLQSGKAYLVSFETWATDPYDERLEVKYGMVPTVDGMTDVLEAPIDVNCYSQNAAMLIANYMIPETDGVYYVGIHGISDPDKFCLFIKDITISEGVLASAPGAPKDVTLVPGQYGAKTCQISFTAPDRNIAGGALSSLDKVEIYRDETLVKTFTSPVVGSSLSFEDTVAAAGTYSYTIVGYNTEGKGAQTTHSVFIGVAEPGPVENVKLAAIGYDGEAVVTWDAVTHDVNGNPIGEGNVTYTVYNQAKEALASGLTTTSYTFQAVPEGDQQFVQVIVTATTESGQNLGSYSGLEPIGKPYEGMYESFANADITYNFGVTAVYGGTVELATDQTFGDVRPQDGDNGYLIMYGEYETSGAILSTGLISLAGMDNPTYSFYLYNLRAEGNEEDTANQDNIIVKIREQGAAEWATLIDSTVDALCDNEPNEWHRVTIKLEDYAGKVIQLSIQSSTRNYKYTLVDNMRVGSMYLHDLKVLKISAPEKVYTGAEYMVDVLVANEGSDTSGNWQAELYKDDALVETRNMESILPGENQMVTFTLTMNAVANENVVLYAKVVYTDDQYINDNRSETIEVEPKLTILPTPTDLVGTVNDQTVELSWTAPDTKENYTEPITEDFENGDAFSNEFGNWTFVDVDASPVGGFSNFSIPNITTGQTKGSFWIWDQNSITASDSFQAHSGSKYLFAMFRYDDEATDDWAISPNLNGSKQTISFYAKSFSSQYPEKIEVYYSTGSVNPSDFIKIEGAGDELVPSDWTLYEIEVPEGALHFAIRSCAAGSFALFIDDVTYIPGGAAVGSVLQGYDVYRDGNKINDTIIEDCRYVDSQIETGVVYKYEVVAVYDNGISAPSEAITVECTTVGVDMLESDVVISSEQHAIVIRNAEGQAINIVTTEGINIFSGVGSAVTKVDVIPDMYIVMVGKTTVKLIVK